MSRLRPSRTERAALCDLFDERGPEAPTLDEGWSTYDLAAHLHIREHDPIGAIGIGMPAFADHHARAIVALQARKDYEQLVADLRAGPPRLWRPIDPWVNVHEWFVHHEDVRRSDGNAIPRPRDEIADVEAAVWTNLKVSGRLLARAVRGVGVDLIDPETGGRLRTGRHRDRLTLSGRPGELLLFLFGRQDVAEVQIEGSRPALVALEQAELGI